MSESKPRKVVANDDTGKWEVREYFDDRDSHGWIIGVFDSESTAVELATAPGLLEAARAIEAGTGPLTHALEMIANHETRSDRRHRRMVARFCRKTGPPWSGFLFRPTQRKVAGGRSSRVAAQSCL